MKNKKIIIYISVILILLVSFLTIYQLNSFLSSKEIPILYSHATYAYDLSTLEMAVGAVNYVFVAKVDSISRTEYRNPVEVETNSDGSKTKTVAEPYTVYEVSVINNIKGELKEKIELVQMGGFSKDDNSYVLLDGTELLEEGKYYIILAYAVSENGELQINSKYTYVKLNVNSEEDINKNEIVLKYISAYENQIIPSEKKDSFKSSYDITR